MHPFYSVIVPCYNEEAVLQESHKRLTQVLSAMDGDYEIIYVNDGSRDRTADILRALTAADAHAKAVMLAKNAGHQMAVSAGLDYASGDAIVIIDADLQDDVNAMYGFLEEFKNGADVVSGVRSSRAKDTFFKRATAQGFYKMMNRLGVEMVYNHADYRLLSKRALHSLLSFGEVNMFLRGMVPMLGYKTAIVKYERGERVAGESKYPLKKMIAFAVEGVTSLSNKPIRYVTFAGLLCGLLGVAMAIYVLASLISGRSVAGWASIMMSIWLLGGLQLTALGLIGEYIGKIYMETKRRPKFILEETLGDDQ